LFGGPRIEHDGAEIEVDTRKAIALLAYLAVTRRPARATL
jgi:DNA-binding SARP family transcriptional activator